MEDRSLHDAFVELHGDRLFGFSLLVTLGDATLAGTLTAQALSKGVARMEQLRHPERAAAWLRANVTHAAKGRAWGHQRPSEIERRDALRPLGVDPAVYDALASLDVRARAAVTATAVEGFTTGDVHEIVGSDNVVRKARRDYMSAYVAAATARGLSGGNGNLAERVDEVASPVLRPRRK
jgi:DNA-directed RNA polymerase specialized sigma24 family protein